MSEVKGKTIIELFNTFISINGKKRTNFNDFEKFCDKIFREESKILQTEALNNYTPDYTNQHDIQVIDVDSLSLIFKKHYLKRMNELQEFIKTFYTEGEVKL